MKEDAKEHSFFSRLFFRGQFLFAEMGTFDRLPGQIDPLKPLRPGLAPQQPFMSGASWYKKRTAIYLSILPLLSFFLRQCGR